VREQQGTLIEKKTDPEALAKLLTMKKGALVALAAEKKVGLMLNVSRANLDAVLGILPALHRPTVAPLSDGSWFSLTTVVDEKIVREILPELIAGGAEGIVEYALNKVVN